MIEKKRPGIETVRATFEDAKESGAGAITFDCPECEAEGRPDEEFTVFANGATSCRRAARAGRDFDGLEDGAVSWKVKGDLPELLEGEPSEGLRVEFLAEIFNLDLPEKKKVFPPQYGITIRSLGFRTRELTKGAYRKKSAVVFCRNDFARMFNSFSLPVPADFVPAAPAPEAKPNNSNEMRAPEQFENESPEKNSSGARISLDTNDLNHGAGDAGTVFQEYEEGEINSDLTEQSDTAPAIVALDTETEPFTEKYSQSKTWVEFRKTGKTPVTPRTARMIGLSLQEADRTRVLNPEIFEEYARNDARYTFCLWPKFARELERQGSIKSLSDGEIHRCRSTRKICLKIVTNEERKVGGKTQSC